MKKYEAIIFIIIISVVMAFTGYQSGKLNVYDKVMNDSIECSLTVNPITAEALR